MSKDPAFLFYTSDFVMGTFLMSDDDVGKYIRLLCLQHQTGHLSEETMLQICKEKNSVVFSKFFIDKKGNYYNKRLEEEADKRSSYCKSRGSNKKGHKKNKNHMKIISKSYENHMEDENEDINKDINTTIIAFEEIWKEYPKPVGKKQALKHFNASVKNEPDLAKIKTALKNYKNSLSVKNGFIQNGSTWFNNWQDWVDFVEKEVKTNVKREPVHHIPLADGVLSQMEQWKKEQESLK